MKILALTSAALVGCLGPLAIAQDTVVTPGGGVLARKVVVYDQGDFWPGAFVRHDDDSVSALGNPWLGGRVRSLQLTGVFDMVRLDALKPGTTEVVAMVGSSGLTLVRWLPATRGFELCAVSDPLAQGARIVRAASFPTNHLIVVVTPGGTSVRCYRQSVSTAGDLLCPLLTSFTPSEPVLDAEAFRAADGSGRLLLRTATGITCTAANGSVQWTLAGSGGRFARWPQSPTVRAAWVHAPAAGSGWVVTRLGDAGPIDNYDVSWAVAANEQMLAAFAVDVDHDGDVDMVLKTSSGVSLLHNEGTNDIPQLAEISFSQLTGSPDCVPDIVVTHAGRRVRLVDAQGGTSIAWSRVDVAPGTPGGVMAMGGDGSDGIIHLVTVDPNTGQSLRGGFASAVVDSGHTQLDFNLHVPPGDLAPFVLENAATQMQIVPWHQQVSTGGSPDSLPEFNRLVELQEAGLGASEPSQWSFSIALNPLLAGWGDQLYWLTVRLCCTLADGSAAKLVSEPMTLVTTLSPGQMSGSYSYISSFVPNETLPTLWWANAQGGVVIGVIQRTIVPPPPPPDLIPTPGEATSTGTAPRTSLQ